MKEKIICFALGLSPEDIEKGGASLYGLNQGAYRLEVIPVTDAMLGLTVGHVLDSVAAGELKQEKAIPPGLFPYRVVVVATSEREQVIQIMRSFKSVLPDPQDLIFAVITETSLSWLFGKYLGHLLHEHEYVKIHRNNK